MLPVQVADMKSNPMSPRFGIVLALIILIIFDARADQSYTVDNLMKPAEIIVDRWGVPHIYAQTHYDAFFVQGFNAARDRLWQIDVWRRRGLGLLSEVFGDQFLEQDRANRLFLYRGGMYREWLAYGSDAKIIAESFAAGVNAYIDLIADNAKLLPPEFDLLDYRPARWHASDIVRIRSHGLLRNVRNEVGRARIVCGAGLEASHNWKFLEPKRTTKVPVGLDPCVIPDDVLETYDLARSAVRFDAPTTVNSNVDVSKDATVQGSNNWVVAPSRTATGRPILANDPHRSHSVPSLRYIAHLVAPGMNVIGAGEPALPGISIGHNDNIAFGLTIFSIDQEDLYVYEKNGNAYRYRDRWEEFKLIRETVAVRDQSDAAIEMKFTRHGPVIHETDTHAFAVRAGWLEPGMAPYFGSLEYMRAGNWREFLGALNRWGTPSENQVYADVDGNIGYKPAGLFPRRPNWDGLMPVPGDGRYEWDGFFDMDVLPVEFNPTRGFTGTANSMNLPDDYPIEKYPMAFEWAEPWRYRRMWQVLSAQDEHSVQDSIALQRDYKALLAIEIIKRIPDSSTGPAVDMLRAWDGVLSAESGPGALYMIWLERHLRPAFEAYIGREDSALFKSLDTRNILQLMSDKDMQKAIGQSLADAYAEAASKLGSDTSDWSWGAIHHTNFTHPLLHMATGELAGMMRFPEHPRGGSGHTTNNTRNFNDKLEVDSGASYRQVIDVGNWDAARVTNAPGQSGDPRSPFYDNLLQGWAEEESFPLLYSRKKIEENRALTIRLRPAD
jgi:penicillin amidase